MCDPHHPTSDREQLVVPVVEETAHIGVREVETGRVRITKTVREERHEIAQPLASDQVEVQRVPINQFVAQPPQVRVEGDTTIIPVLEEVVVVEKRLRLKEELHVTRRRTTREHREPVTLRREEVHVQREDFPNSPA